MTHSVQLVPLLCPKCQTVLQARAGETAWACRACGSIAGLSNGHMLQSFPVHFQQTVSTPARGKPYWLLKLQTALPNLEGVSESVTQLMIPAYAMSVRSRLQRAQELLITSAPLIESDPYPFSPVVIPPYDLEVWLDLLLRKMKAHPPADLKQFTFGLQLRELNLWILAD